MWNEINNLIRLMHLFGSIVFNTFFLSHVIKMFLSKSYVLPSNISTMNETIKRTAVEFINLAEL